MKIGIVGSGSIGGTLGLLWAAKGHAVLFSSRHPENLSHLVESSLGNAQAGTIAEAVAYGEVILFSPHYRSFPEAVYLAGGAEAFEGKVVIDATNPFGVEGGPLEPAEGQTGCDIIRDALPGARIVKAINSIYYKHFGEGNSPIDDKVGAPYCGVDEDAKEIVAMLLDDLSLDPVDLGGWEMVHHTEPGGELFNIPMSAEGIKEIVF